MSLDFKAANAKLAADVLGFCQKYLPGGTVKGGWYLVRVPWRTDKNPSLGVSLTTAKWRDFGRENDRGDLVDIISKLERRPAVDIVRELTS